MFYSFSLSILLFLPADINELWHFFFNIYIAMIFFFFCFISQIVFVLDDL